MAIIIPMMTNVMNEAVEKAVQGLLHEASQEFEGPSIEWERESRAAFESSELDESQWSAWIDAWIDAAYEQASIRLHPLDFECLTDWCTCGDSRADHYGSRSHCVHEHCDCQRFKRSAREKRPTPRRTVQTWSKGIDPRLAV